MRRWWAMVCAVCLLVLPGCSRRSAKPETVYFSCKATVQYKDLSLTADLSRTDKGTLRMAITSPATLRDLVMTARGDTVTVELNGIKFDLTPEQLPVSGLGQGILDALDAAAASNGIPTVRDGEGVLPGSGENGSFTLTVDPVTGALRSLSIPALPLTATFTDFVKTE